MKTFEITLNKTNYTLISNNEEHVVQGLMNQIKYFNLYLLNECGLNDWSINISELKSNTIFAECQYNTKRILVNISTLYLAPTKLLREIIIHEIAHALTPNHNHDDVWKSKAIELGGSGDAIRTFKSLKKLDINLYQVEF